MQEKPTRSLCFHATLSNAMKKTYFSDILFKVKLSLRLFKDARVSLWLKIIPISCLLYLIAPIGLLSGPIDDAFIIYLGMDVFIEFCPKELVREHKLALQGTSAPDTGADVIEAEFKE